MESRKQVRPRRKPGVKTPQSAPPHEKSTEENCQQHSLVTLKRRRSARLADKRVLKDRNFPSVDAATPRTTAEPLLPASMDCVKPGLPAGSLETPSPMQTHIGPERWKITPSSAVVGFQPLMNFSECTPEQSLLDFRFHVSSPLPRLPWADSERLWSSLKSADRFKLEPELQLKRRHPCLTPHMRAILLDWMQEVCEVYRLHRETYFLAIDLYDRYIESQVGISKDTLQRIGVTCLFAAAKIEEIYPPKVKEFAYVTDGACVVSDILEEELKMYKALGWRMARCYTVNNWVNTMMQLGGNVSRSVSPPSHRPAEFAVPKYCPSDFVKVMSLLDLCSLDITHRAFSASAIAAASMYLVLESCRRHFSVITGVEVFEILDCLQWMIPFWDTLRCGQRIVLREFHGPPEVLSKDSHNIQTHVADLRMLDAAVKARNKQLLQVDTASRQLFVSSPSSGFPSPASLNV